jgi:hypothetical protein
MEESRQDLEGAVVAGIEGLGSHPEAEVQALDSLTRISKEAGLESLSDMLLVKFTPLSELPPAVLKQSPRQSLEELAMLLSMPTKIHGDLMARVT